MFSLRFAVALAAWLSLASAFTTSQQGRIFSIPKPDKEDTQFPSDVPSAYFDQLLDHDNPDLGTFPQLYYYSAEWWGGPGFPVILV